MSGGAGAGLNYATKRACVGALSRGPMLAWGCDRGDARGSRLRDGRCLPLAARRLHAGLPTRYGRHRNMLSEAAA